METDVDTGSGMKRNSLDFLQMRCGGSGLALVLAAGLLAAASPAGAASYTFGHADLEIAYDDATDDWEFAFLCEGCTIDGTPIVGEQEFEADEVTIVVPITTGQTATGAVAGVVDDTPTGAPPGSTYYKMPESETESDNDGVGFLGIARDEIELGVFTDDEITLELVGISFTDPEGDPGSAEYSLFSSDAGLGNPIPHFWMSTFDEPATVNGDNTLDGLSVGPGAHSHFNHGFTEFGTYEVTYQASGELLDEFGDPSGIITSGQGTYTFQVTPEPGTGMLVAGALAGLAHFGRRKERVAS